MAATEQESLTEQHRQAQLQLQARAIRDYLVLWPLWTGDGASFASLVQATRPLVNTYRQISSTLSSSYYQALRTAENVPGSATVALAAPVSPEALAASMYSTGQTTTRQALSGGRSPETARQAALTRTSGAVTRQVLNGGRETIIGAVAADKEALGWARVTDGDPCAFCLTLASRGAVYKSETTADFQAHDHCGCTAAPLWAGTKLPAQTAQWKKIYNQAQREGVASGALQPGENPSKDRLNAVRRHLANK